MSKALTAALVMAAASGLTADDMLRSRAPFDANRFPVSRQFQGSKKKAREQRRGRKSRRKW